MARPLKIFGTMKRRYLYRRVSYRGLIRNRCQLWLLCMAMNLHRADQITA
jgi:IS5 family transposase